MYERRLFTFEEANRLVEPISLLTARAREEMEHIWESLNLDVTERELSEGYQRINAAKRRWYARIREHGAVPRRLWEVDFETEYGLAFSWRFGEKEIRYCHSLHDFGPFPFRIPIPARLLAGNLGEV